MWISDILFWPFQLLWCSWDLSFKLSFLFSHFYLFTYFCLLISLFLFPLPSSLFSASSFHKNFLNLKGVAFSTLENVSMFLLNKFVTVCVCVYLLTGLARACYTWPRGRASPSPVNAKSAIFIPNSFLSVRIPHWTTTLQGSILSFSLKNYSFMKN